MIQQIGLFPHRTIAQNIATVPNLLGWKQDRTDARVAELLELIGLDPEISDRYPVQLSGGQQQRVGVARALAGDPLVMLMDEPFGAIDPINRERLQNEFLRLQAEIRKTVLFVTHDIDEAIKMGDRIAVMREGGRVAQYATPAELLMAPADEFVEDFVGADRALKRLALMRVGDIGLWEAPLAYVGQPTSEVLAKLEGAEVPYPLLIDSERRPARLALRAGPRRRRSSPRSPTHRWAPCSTETTSCATRSPTCSRRGPSTPRSTDASGQIAGVLSVEIISEFLASPAAETEERGAAERIRMLAAPSSSAMSACTTASNPDCIQRNDLFCPGWAVDNFDRYVDPTVQHLVLVLASVCAGFAIAFALALLAHRHRWLGPPFLAPPESSTRSPASPSSSCCCRSPAAAAPRRSSP